MLHGLRIGEALGMTWENIDLEHNTITVNQQLQDISMKLKKIVEKPAGLKATGEGNGYSRLEKVVGGRGLEPLTPCV